MGINDVLGILAKYGIVSEENGYETIPQEHAFATWRKAHRKADGADGYAMYWDVTYEVRIFYHDERTRSDKAREKLIENELRELNGLESDYDYNSNDKCDITLYTFNGTEEF